MDGELKHVKTGWHNHTSTLQQSWGKNLYSLIPSPAPWAKHHLSSLNKFALVFQWQIDGQSGLKVCHGWKTSTVIPKLTRSLNFPSAGNDHGPLNCRHHKTPGDEPWLCHSSAEIENSECFGTWNRHQWTVNSIYMYVYIFARKSLKMLWRRWKQHNC